MERVSGDHCRVYVERIYHGHINLQSDIYDGDPARSFLVGSALVRILTFYCHGDTDNQFISNSSKSLTKVFSCFSSLLRLAIVGLSSQYLSEQISHRDYLAITQTYKDESERLARVSALAEEQGGASRSSNVDDGAIRCTEEYRFMMVRHWSLYESMYNSNYVASRLGIWREPGRQRLLALLAKMGYVFAMELLAMSICSYSVMDELGKVFSIWLTRA